LKIQFSIPGFLGKKVFGLFWEKIMIIYSEKKFPFCFEIKFSIFFQKKCSQLFLGIKFRFRIKTTLEFFPKKRPDILFGKTITSSNYDLHNGIMFLY
jgi:hypothetical protein